MLSSMSCLVHAARYGVMPDPCGSRIYLSAPDVCVRAWHHVYNMRMSGVHVSCTTAATASTSSVHRSHLCPMSRRIGCTGMCLHASFLTQQRPFVARWHDTHHFTCFGFEQFLFLCTCMCDMMGCEHDRCIQALVIRVYIASSRPHHSDDIDVAIPYAMTSMLLFHLTCHRCCYAM